MLLTFSFRHISHVWPKIFTLPHIENVQKTTPKETSCLCLYCSKVDDRLFTLKTHMAKCVFILWRKILKKNLYWKKVTGRGPLAFRKKWVFGRKGIEVLLLSIEQNKQAFKFF